MPNNLEDLFDRINELLDANRHVEAIEACDAEIEAHPANCIPHSAKGLVLERMGETESALISFEKASEIETNFRDHYNAGNMLLKLQRFDEAIAKYDISLELAPGYPQSWVNRGIAFNNKGSYSEAGYCFDKAIEVDEKFIPAWRCKAILRGQENKFEDCEAAYKKVAELNPRSPDAWYELGLALSRNLPSNQVFPEEGGRDREAFYAFSKAVKLAPERESFWIHKIRSIKKLLHACEAIATAGTAVGIGPPIPIENLRDTLDKTVREAKRRFPKSERIQIIDTDGSED